MRKLFVICKQYTTGKIEDHSAYFSEETAKYEARKLIGKTDGYGDIPLVIGLRTIEVLDKPLELELAAQPVYSRRQFIDRLTSAEAVMAAIEAYKGHGGFMSMHAAITAALAVAYGPIATKSLAYGEARSAVHNEGGEG